MYPRLKLAQNLLTDDGVIFISIDDNEVHNLRKMCDEVFGGKQFRCMQYLAEKDHWMQQKFFSGHEISLYIQKSAMLLRRLNVTFMK
jgi:hypothetical protein